MKIRFLRDRVTKARPEDQEKFEKGKVYDLPETSAQRWINRQVAEAVVDRPHVGQAASEEGAVAGARAKSK